MSGFQEVQRNLEESLLNITVNSYLVPVISYL